MLDDAQLWRPAVEGYCDRRSYRPGDEVQLHCSTAATSFAVEIARVGATREVVHRIDGVAGAQHGVPDDASTHGCRWPAATSVVVPDEWRSGFYEVRFVPDAADRTASEPAAESGHAFFVVRAPVATAPILLVLSTNTYNAYNRFGGGCLYRGATRVSFERPLDPGYLVKPVDADGFDGRFASPDPNGDRNHLRLVDYLREHRLQIWTSSSGWWNWERRFVRWAEANGIALDYAVNSDLEDHPEVVDGHRLVVSMGHDEYWSWAMRDTIETHVDAGGNAAFFGGNNVLWQVRYEADGQQMVCFKAQAADDPVLGTDDERRLSTFFAHPVVDRPENATTGLSFFRGGYVRIGDAVPRSSGTYTVYRPDHWALEGTGLRYGDQLGVESRPVGYECDGCTFTMVDGHPVPTGEDATPDGFEIIGITPARLISVNDEVCEAPEEFWASLDPPGDLETAAAVLFGDASPDNVARVAQNHAVIGAFTRGGTVFNAGTCDWAYGLDSDPVVQQVTTNVLHHLST